MADADYPDLSDGKSEYHYAKAYVNGLTDLKEKGKLNKEKIKYFNYGFLTGAQMEELPDKRMIKSLLFNKAPPDEGLIKMLKEIGIIESPVLS